MEDIYSEIMRLLSSGTLMAVATIIQVAGSFPRGLGPRYLVPKEGQAFGRRIRRWCEENPLTGLRVESFESNGQSVEVLLEPIQADPTLFIFAVDHIAQALSPLGKMTDFRVVVIDNRPMFANSERFPEADQVLVEPFEIVMDKLQINPRSYVVIVTPGHLYDGEVLEQAVQTDAVYVGMIGSEREIAVLYKDLIKKGIKEELIDRVYAPIGLHIYSETPAEIAISIMAELIKVRAENARAGTLKPI